MQNSSHASSNKKHTSHVTNNSLVTNKINVNNNNNNTIINNLPYDLQVELENLEREADMQSKEIELNECVEFVSQLVDLLKHTVIIPELQSGHDWHDDVGHQLKRNKGITGNTLLDDKIEKIVIKKGLNKEQWKRLLYLNFTAGDSLEMNNVCKSHLKKVRDMASRLLDDDERATVFALINAIETHMPKKHFTEK